MAKVRAVGDSKDTLRKDNALLARNLYVLSGNVACCSFVLI